MTQQCTNGADRRDKGFPTIIRGQKFENRGHHWRRGWESHWWNPGGQCWPVRLANNRYLVSQKRRKLDEERRQATKVEADKLLKAGKVHNLSCQHGISQEGKKKVAHVCDWGLSLDSIQEELEDEPLQFKGPMTKARSKRLENQIYSRILMLQEPTIENQRIWRSWLGSHLKDSY